MIPYLCVTVIIHLKAMSIGGDLLYVWQVSFL